MIVVCVCQLKRSSFFTQTSSLCVFFQNWFGLLCWLWQHKMTFHWYEVFFIDCESVWDCVHVCIAAAAPWNVLTSGQSFTNTCYYNFFFKFLYVFSHIKNGKQREDPVKYAGIMLQTCNMTAMKNESLWRGVLVLKKLSEPLEFEDTK